MLNVEEVLENLVKCNTINLLLTQQTRVRAVFAINQRSISNEELRTYGSLSSRS